MFKRGLTTFLGNSMRWLELSPSNSENIIFTIFLQLSESFGFIIALDEQREIYGSFFWDNGDSVDKQTNMYNSWDVQDSNDFT